MIVGPIFYREMAVQPRRLQHYVARTAYPLALVTLIWTAWLVLHGTQVIRSVGDMARFGASLFYILATLQLAVLTFLGAITAASAVAQEKDKKTFVLLLMTQLNNSEVVVGRLAAALLEVLLMLLTAAPIFMLLPLLGGVSFAQVALALLVTAVTIITAGSVGSLIALAREKTFQSLAMTVLTLVAWPVLAEGGRLAAEADLLPRSAAPYFAAVSPWAALQSAILPFESHTLRGSPAVIYAMTTGAIAVLLNLIAVARLRVWNPGREMFQMAPAEEESPAADVSASDDPEAARKRHVDARVRKVNVQSRPVWDNPILWRETQTRAYGRKLVIVRIAYWAIFAFTLATLAGWLFEADPAVARGEQIIPQSAAILAPFFALSLVIVNALAVTCITNERDAAALDLLLVTDLSPREFTFGKLLGAAWVTKEMIALPLVIVFYLLCTRGLSFENWLCLTLGILVMDVFALMLGIHYGSVYANSRTAIGVSLGTIFFLFLGVVTVIMLLISFSGSFTQQFLPFLAFVVGGGVGLYIALGSYRPSSAIGWAAFLLPMTTFYAVISFLVGHWLTVFLVIAATYGFTTTALMIPALWEFDFAKGRSQATEE